MFVVTAAIAVNHAWSLASPTTPPAETRSLSFSDLVFETGHLDENEIFVIPTTYSGLGLFEFPKGSRLGYLLATKLTVGCVRGLDTLVTEFGEFPWLGAFASFEGGSYTRIDYRSARRSDRDYRMGTLADRELTIVLTDTAVLSTRYLDPVEFRPHVPIGLEVHETVRAWSGAYLGRAVFVEFTRSEERRVGKECRSRWSPYH